MSDKKAKERRRNQTQKKQVMAAAKRALEPPPLISDSSENHTPPSFASSVMGPSHLLDILGNLLYGFSVKTFVRLVLFFMVLFLFGSMMSIVKEFFINFVRGVVTIIYVSSLKGTKMPLLYQVMAQRRIYISFYSPNTF